MEENSDALMETDVSSTTDHEPEVPQVEDSNGNVDKHIPIVVVVEQMKEEGESSSCNTPSTSTTASPQKSATPQKVTKPPCVLNELSEKILSSSFEESLIKNKPRFSPKTTPVKQQPESSDSPKTSPGQNVIQLKIMKPIKLVRTREKSLNNDVKILEKSPVKDVQNKPDKEATLVDICNKEVNLPKKSDTTVSSEENIDKKETGLSNLPKKDTNLKDKSTNDNKIQSSEKSDTEKMPEPASSMEVDLVDSNIKDQSSPQEVPVQDTASKVSINEISMSDSSSDKSSCDTNLPDKESKNNNEDISLDISVVPTDDSLITETNDSQISMDVEKDHNKSISRELKSLINSAKESKIISECTQVKSKMRKSRSQLDTSNTSLNVSSEADKVGNRRGSNNSQVSNSSEHSDKAKKRSMRLQNAESSNKSKLISSLALNIMKDCEEAVPEDSTATKSIADTTLEHSNSVPPSPKKKKVSDQPVLDVDKTSKFRSDKFCWRCHWNVEQENNKAHDPMHCSVCPRSYHYKCLSTSERKISTETSWVCPDCLQILHAEGSDTRSPAMKKTSLGTLCDLLKYALERMMDINGIEPFMQPVDRASFPDYDKYVIHPMDLSQMKKNIADGLYGSTEAFVADVQWILHNSIIFNTCEQAFLQSKLTGGARALVRSCRAEMSEIEACPECYAAAHARKPTWFTDVCTTPHILLWAKLKGFPYWPAKSMSVNSSGLVDVRFFGAHDRAWVPAKDCFLFSEKDPNNFRSKRQDILDSMQEAEHHIRNLSRKYGKFVYPPFKTQFDPSKLTEQLKLMIPTFEGEIRSGVKDKPVAASPLAKAKRRSNSKGSKSSANDGDGSDTEEISTSARTEVLKVSKTDINEKSEKNTSERVAKVDSPVVTRQQSQTEEPPVTRKRRRSNLEEARVMTVIESSGSPVPEKKNRIETDQQEPTSSKKEDKAHSTTKEEAKPTSKKKTEPQKSKSKDEEPSSSTHDDKESLRVTPIKLVALPRTNKQTPKMFATTKSPPNPTSSKEEDKTPQKTKTSKPDKPSTSEKSKEEKPKRHSTSKANKSLNGTSVLKTSKSTDKKAENDTTPAKDTKTKESKKKETDSDAKKSTANAKSKATDSPRTVTFDDDTSLAVIARERRRSHANLPTISSVCSLSTTAQSSIPTASPSTSTPQIEITIEANCNSSIFKPTSTETVTNMKDAVNKLQKLRDITEPIVGRVGVRAFARMTSPGREISPTRPENMEIEIKAEPIDLEEDETRLNEKMNLMNACKLQPVGQSQGLRDVRINRVVAGPSAAKKTEPKPRARKTFPQPKPNEARSELNGKNTMVYIPIQPPSTQPPVRPVRPTSQALRLNAPVGGNNAVNTLITPLKPTSSHSSPSAPNVVNIPHVGPVSGPTVGQVPTTVHTVPLMTSVNGQWMFSLQPVMSVGGVDSLNSSPMVNGSTAPGIVPMSAPAVNSPGTPVTTPAQTNRNASDNTATELPRLQPRPTLVHPLDAAPGAAVPTATASTPLTGKLMQNAQKLTDFFRTLIEDTIEKLDEPTAAATSLRLQLEQSRWRHKLEMDELKHNHELTLAEMRLTFEKDKLRVANDARRSAQAELDAAVKVAKSKQWCANCNQEAQFYCCWNTSYCELPCQRAHWPTHFTQCAQRSKDGKGDDSGSSESRVQILPDVLPALQKSTTSQAPALTVGGKIATRVFSPQDTAAQKASIIVSMVEDNSGNQTMKCVGTYKPGTQTPQMPPLVINKVINDETAKKVVTSGGYLIVGAGNNASIITPASQPRRPNTIQYFT